MSFVAADVRTFFTTDFNAERWDLFRTRRRSAFRIARLALSVLGMAC
jgi:hypothetical protein